MEEILKAQRGEYHLRQCGSQASGSLLAPGQFAIDSWALAPQVQQVWIDPENLHSDLPEDPDVGAS